MGVACQPGKFENDCPRGFALEPWVLPWVLPGRWECDWEAEEVGVVGRGLEVPDVGWEREANDGRRFRWARKEGRRDAGGV